MDPSTERDFHVERVRWLPLTPLCQSCILVVNPSHITCRTVRGEEVFSGHPSEFHSFAPALGSGFHLWHGPKRHRFVHFTPMVRQDFSDMRVVQDVVGDVAKAQESAEVIRALISPWPPIGVAVRRPLGFVAYLMTILAIGWVVVTAGSIALVLTAGATKPYLTIAVVIPLIVFGGLAFWFGRTFGPPSSDDTHDP